MGLSADLEIFAADVGTSGPVAVSGGRTQWDVGGPPEPGTRVVAAPRGVAAFEPAEASARAASESLALPFDEEEAASTVSLPFDSEEGSGTPG